jgi:signal transduction histidine kinase
MQPSPYVLLHFQLSDEGKLVSPQSPTGVANTLALGNGVPAANMDLSNSRLMELESSLDQGQLLAALPAGSEQEIGITQFQIGRDENWLAQGNGTFANNAYVNNSLAYPPVQQEVELALNPSPQQAAPTPQQQASDDLAYQSQQRAQRGSSRAANDLEQRNRAYQSATQRQIVEQRLNLNYGPVSELKYVREGVMQPVWQGERLLLARRVKVGEKQLVQGCWLDWDKIRGELTARHAQTLPGLTLMPLRPDIDRHEVRVSRLLATLPVQLVLPEMTTTAQPWSPLRMSLIVAWSMLALAAGAVAMLLQGVITLSERRGAFVSAVTHELRTPLTTFRMYAEMLAENMVPSAESRQKYLETLRVEADRLSHLVENVLAYARLERGRHGQRRETTAVNDIVQRCSDRFADRAAQAGMTLVVKADPSASDETIETDPAAVEQILFNLIDNACKYAATAEDRRLHLETFAVDRYVIVRVRDHGPGIDDKAARRLFQPFSKSVHDAASSAPGVGLGLALSRRLAHELGGRLEHEGSTQSGASFVLYLPRARSLALP